MKDNWPRTDDGSYHIGDLICPEFEEVLDSKDRAQLLNLATELDSRWKSHFHQVDCIPVKNSSGKQIATTLSSFLIKLQTYTWLPCEQSEHLLKPEKLYLKTNDVFSVLDRFGHYFEGKLSDEKFIDAIKLRNYVSLETIFENLSEWCRDDTFSTSLNHMINVYHFIKNRFHEVDPAELKIPLVFVPSELEHLEPDKKCRGKFHERGEVCLYDFSCVFLKRGELLQKKRVLLFRFYPKDILEFFRQDLKIDESPTIRDYISLACAVADNTKLPDVEAYEDLMEVFSAIGLKCISSEYKDPFKELVSTCENLWDCYEELHKYIDCGNANFVYENVKEGKLLPTNRDKFVSVKEMPLLPDDKNLLEIYEREERVHFIDLKFTTVNLEKNTTSIRFKGRRNNNLKQKEKKHGIMAFFVACKIKAISGVVGEVEVIPENNVEGCEQWHKSLSALLPYIQRYIYAKNKDIYDTLIDQNISKKLRNLKFFTANNIETIHRIKERNDVNVRMRKNCCIEKTEESIFFYISKQSMNETDDILAEAVKIFCMDNESNAEGLLDLLTSISYVMHSPDQIEKRLRRKTIGELPQGEEVWKLMEIVKPQRSREIPQTQTSEKTIRSEPNELKSWPPRAQESLGSFPPRNRKENDNALLSEWIEPAPPESFAAAALNTENQSAPAHQVPGESRGPIVIEKETSKELGAFENVPAGKKELPKDASKKSHRTQTVVKKEQSESMKDEAGSESSTFHRRVDIGSSATKEESNASVVPPPPQVTDAEDSTLRSTRVATGHRPNSLPSGTGNMDLIHGKTVFTPESQKQPLPYIKELVPFENISKEVGIFLY